MVRKDDGSHDSRSYSRSSIVVLKIIFAAFGFCE